MFFLIGRETYKCINISEEMENVKNKLIVLWIFLIHN